MTNIENDSRTAWGVPRPAVRLWLTLALGIFGAVLFPGKQEFIANPFANVQGTRALAWMSAALAAVLLLHRTEKAKVSMPSYALMGLALAMSLMFFQGYGFGWLCFICLVLVAGISVSKLRFERGTGFRSWMEPLVRGPAVALAAPLALFAARPIGCGSTYSMQTVTRAGFVVFLYALAAGFTLTLFGSDYIHRHAPRLGLTCYSFSVWAWLGCALLFVLSPWPEYPRTPMRAELPKPHKAVLLGTIVFAAMVLLMLFPGSNLLSLLRELNWHTLRQLIAIFNEPLLACLFALPCLGFALLFLLSPWPGFPCLPKLGELSPAQKVSPLATIGLMAMALIPFASFACGPFLYVVSGQLFASQFNPAHVGGALDQPSLTKWLFLFTFWTALVFPYVAAARWMSDRSTRLGYWAFAVSAAALCLCLLSILTLPFWWLIQYIHAMGFTLTRGLGLVYALCGYALVTCFFCWAVCDLNARQGVVRRRGAACRPRGTA